MTKASDAERNRAIAQLRDMIKPGDTLYTILRHISRSGMQRRISVLQHDTDGIGDISWTVAKAIGWPVNRGRTEGIVVDGAGMDMGFHLVYTLSQVLYPTYQCIGEGDGSRRSDCPSNAHVNAGPDRDKYGAGVTHKDGYALRQRWV